jgi:hypothetical protein
MQVRPIASSQGKLVGGEYVPNCYPEDYLDIAYVAFFDDIDDVKEVFDSETYEWSVDKDTSVLRKTEDHACATHAYAYEKNAQGYVLTCGGCGLVGKTVTIPEDINWYSSLDSMNKYTAKLTQNQVDGENLVLYNRYTSSTDNHLNITGGSGAGTWTTDKYETGQYLVIKYRAEGGSFNIFASTKDNGPKPASDGRPDYSYLGTFTGSETMSEWRVAVIKLPENGKYTCNSEQEIAIMLATSGAFTFDVAYFAAVDSIDEAKELLFEGEDYYFFDGKIANEGGELNGGNDAASDTEGSGS